MITNTTPAAMATAEQQLAGAMKDAEDTLNGDGITLTRALRQLVAAVKRADEERREAATLMEERARQQVASLRRIKDAAVEFRSLELDLAIADAFAVIH